MISLNVLQTATAKTLAVVTLVAILGLLLARTVGAAAGDNASPNNQGNQ